MSDIEINKEISEFNQLIAELDVKYFEKVCEVFAEARDDLLAKIKLMLGEEYTSINDRIKEIKKEIADKRLAFDEEKDTIILKGRLTVAKEKIMMAKSDVEKSLAKKEMNEALGEISKRNLTFFSQLSTLKNDLDGYCLKAIDLVKAKEEDFKVYEKEIVDSAKEKTTALAVQYKSEAMALANVFDVKNYLPEMSFLKEFDLNTRLIDFDKQSFLDAFYNREKGSSCVGCVGNCSTCHSAANIEDKKFFNSPIDDDFDN